MSTSADQPDRVTRRDFLKRGGATLVAAGAAAGAAAWLYDGTGKGGLQRPKPEQLPNFFADIDYPASGPRISVVHGSGDGAEVIDRMVRAAVGPLSDGPGLSRFIKKGDVVVLKPNVGFERAAKFAATTDPDVVASVIRLCKEAGAAEVIVTDNPIEAPANCFARSGIGAAARRAGARVVMPAKVHFKPLAIRPPQADGRPHQPDPARHEALGTWPVLWEPLRDADKVIGITPIKDHNLCHASMGMKNWYGLLGGRRNQFHQAIHNIVSDLGMMMSPTLMIVDGLNVLVRGGPTGGSLSDVKPGHTIAAAVDQLACDAWAYETLLGRDPAALRYLDLAQDKFGNEESGPRSYAQSRRIAQRDWKAYKNQGLIVENTV